MPDIYISSGEIIIRLVVSAFFGGVIGMERETSKSPAGFRTHILVTMGSALIMMISATAFDPIGQGNDPLRLAAQVITGIGFLGAGSILREGSEVRGLTTAATLWVCAAIGLSIGAGLYLLGGISSVVVMITLTVLNRIDEKSRWNVLQIISKKDESNFKDFGDFRKLIVHRELKYGVIEDLETRLESYNFEIIDVKINRVNTTEDEDLSFGELELLILKDDSFFTKNELVNIVKDIFNMPGIVDVQIKKYNGP